ncbi:hypothetical protein STTU_3085 [Streptomyces sp. Tu6071]|nr:hypothetical protein STTU_3085 [Streptomyces sp. Tu6071]
MCGLTRTRNSVSVRPAHRHQAEAVLHRFGHRAVGGDSGGTVTVCVLSVMCWLPPR